MTSELLDARAVATIIGVKPNTLAHWRTNGAGPKFFKLNRRVIFLERDLVAYLRALATAAAMSNTSKPAAKISMFPISTAIWHKEKDGRSSYSATFQRSYRDEKGN